MQTVLSLKRIPIAISGVALYNSWRRSICTDLAGSPSKRASLQHSDLAGITESRGGLGTCATGLCCWLEDHFLGGCSLRTCGFPGCMDWIGLEKC